MKPAAPGPDGGPIEDHSCCGSPPDQGQLLPDGIKMRQASAFSP
jgi:hypothetical protein